MIDELGVGVCVIKVDVQWKKTVGRKEASMATLQEASNASTIILK